MEKQNNHIDRRGFLKIVGISAATTTAALYGCGSGTKSSQGRNASSPVPTDQMTYRSVGGIKDKVSLLGYGCMRWPTVPSPEGIISIHHPYTYRAGRKKQPVSLSRGIRARNFI